MVGYAKDGEERSEIERFSKASVIFFILVFIGLVIFINVKGPGLTWPFGYFFLIRLIVLIMQSIESPTAAHFESSAESPFQPLAYIAASWRSAAALDSNEP